MLSGANYLVVKIECCSHDDEILRLRTQNDRVLAEVTMPC
jgi:hypothetical protein